MNYPVLEYILQNKRDAVIFKAERLVELAGGDSFSKGLTVNPICRMLAQLDNEVLQEEYIKSICKVTGFKPNQLTSELKKEHKKQEEENVKVLKENETALPSWVDEKHYYKYSFVQRYEAGNTEKTGIYFSTGGKLPERLTNFTLKAIAHVKTDGSGNRRIAEVANGMEHAIIEIPSKLFSSPDNFESNINDLGVYYCEPGFTRHHLGKLKAYLMPQFKPCFELENLGWQPEGFFAYFNVIYKEGLFKYDEFGIAKVDDINYLSLGASNILKGLRKNKTMYDFIGVLKYVESPISFYEWTSYMVDVYQDNGIMGVAHAILAAFKDLVLAHNNNCPLPYGVGPANSGKTKWAESIAAVFMLHLPPLNLNQTTIPAMWARLDSFYNVPMIFNEFDENAIDEKMSKAFKGAFDNEGRTRGTITKNKSETQEVKCLAILLGQYLTTSDDGAILQRTLPSKFSENNERTDYQIMRFEELKRLEKAGLTSLSAEIIKQRGHVIANYDARFSELHKKMKNALAAENLIPKMRILENYVNVLTMTTLVREKLEMAFSADQMFELCKKSIKSLSLIINESNALSGFWQMLEFLIDQQLIEQGYHFKVETKSDVIIAADREEKTRKTFSDPKKLLFLRLNTVHTLYMSEMRKIGKRGIDLHTILIYMKEQPSYIGNSPSGGFRGKRNGATNTSSFVFDYDMLNANLERFNDQDEVQQTSITGKLVSDAAAISTLGVSRLTFKLFSTELITESGIPVTKQLYTKCFYSDIQVADKLRIHTPVKLTGHLSVNGNLRTLEVSTIEYTQPVDPMDF